MKIHDKLDNIFQTIAEIYNDSTADKIVKYLYEIPAKCKLNKNAAENRKAQQLDEHKHHPMGVIRGEIYFAFITEGIGSELSGEHLIIIMQNKKANIYASKVNVLPIEGDGNKINPNYHIRLSNNDLLNGHLDKNPSRIIISDITTIEKSRLQRKIATIKPEKMNEVSEKLRQQLSLN